MDVSMDPMENKSVTDESNSEEQQNQPDGEEASVRPSLSQVRKSWGFRRSTIARREFLDEVGDLNHSPTVVRRGRSRRSNETPQATPETRANQRATRANRSVIDELEWSAPSSPVSEESKPASEASAGASFDPTLWQDFGSAFHTAFSLLGGNEGLSMDVSDALPVPDILEATDAIKASPPRAIDEAEVLDNAEFADDIEISQPTVATDSVAGGESDDVVLISSQEDDSDEMTLIQIKEKLASQGRQGDMRGKGGRGKARGRGRGRGKGRGKSRGRGRGRGRAAELQSSIADDEDSNDDVMLVNPAEQQLQMLQEEEKVNHPHSPSEIETSPPHSDINLSPAQQSSSDCIIIDTDLDQVTDVTPGQYDEATEEEEEKKDDKNEEECSGVSDSEDSNTLYCICRQKQNKRFMICCDGCQEWFHGDCVGISETQGRKMEKNGQEYICPNCTTKKQSQLQPEPHPQPEPEPSFSPCLTLSPSGEEGTALEGQQAFKETVVVVVEEEEEKKKEKEEEEENEEAPVTTPVPEPEAQMETDSCLPLCIGPGCSKQALKDSVYCGTDCILQHAAVTMKTLSGSKVPKSRGRVSRKAAAARPNTKGQRPGRMSKRLAGKAEEEGEKEELKEDDGGQEEAASPLACDPSLTEVQATSIPSSQFYTASNKDSKQVEAVIPSKQSPEDISTDAAPSSQPSSEPAPTQTCSQEKAKEPINSVVSKQQTAESNPSLSSNPAKSSHSTDPQSPSTSAPRHHETGALMVTKTTYVIPKKQSGPAQPPSSHVSASASCQKPSAAPTLLNETRNLPVPPAPSAPSSRPSQPNNQVRQSIQRSLTSILSKRLCDCEDLEMSDSEVTKLVASIEMEMFDIFRNTDSKYMNKYRTIMFNLKDPRNKGLLYRVVRGEIGPFRLVRMSQKDMQAIKASEPSAKETTEVKDAAAKATSLLQKPEAVKVDLPSLNPTRPDRGLEQKKSLPASALMTRTSQPSQGNAFPDILTCMLKDTTSEHKAHLFDLKCKICTGQMLAGDEEEPAKKKTRVSETRDKYEPSWRKSVGDDSPLRVPPDSPDMDSPTSSLMDPTSRLIIDSPALTILESPASPIMDSPASPTFESPTSPVLESPASPTPDPPKVTPKRAYTPVVIPAVSTVTITRRDPRTAASRFSASPSGTSGPSNTTHNQLAPCSLLKETASVKPSAPAFSLPPTKTLPKSILMKPSSSVEPRLYCTSTRTVISESPAHGESAQFLAKQDIVWKGFLNMLSVAKFVTKAYLVSGPAENLKADLPDTIQIGGRIMPQTVWDYVAKLKTSVTKELCVIRFHPATEEEEVAYVSLFSYFSSRGRFGVVANGSRSIKDVYLVPLSAKESIPTILQPLEGPGLEKNRPNLLLGLAVIQKAKRPGSLTQEIEEKRPKVHMSKDPMWIPKPPVLYGSDKLEIFQPYDPETPSSTTPPGSPSCPGSPSESSSSSSVTIPSILTSKANPPVSSSAAVVATPNSMSNKNPTTASNVKTPLQTIFTTLFYNKQTDSMVSPDKCSTTTVSVKKQVFSQVSGSMVDPIVQQYGQKSKVKEIEEENYFDRPYDPEEEYDPAIGYAPHRIEKNKADGPSLSGVEDDDVAYDPEDETIFADIQSKMVTKPPVPTQMDSPSCPTSLSNQAVMPAPTSTSAQTSNPNGVTENPPTGTVVVSAATLTEQQRMLEELNKQIEEQKRQLKEQEEALRQQREAVGMFMAHFSVSDSLMSPPPKSLPLSQLSSLQSGISPTESRSSESTDKTSKLTENVDTQTVKLEDTTANVGLKNDTDTVTEQDETEENVKDCDKYSSAGEIEDSDVAYDPEDESLFNEIQEDVFQGGSIKTYDSSLSRSGHGASRKGNNQNSYHTKKRRLSPKRRSHRERGSHRSPSKRSQRRSPSHSRRRRERDRHRRSERDRSRHRTRDQSERQGRHRKEHTTPRHSRGHRRSLSPRKTDSVPLSPKQYRETSPKVLEKSKHLSVLYNAPDSVVGQVSESKTSSCTLVTIKNEPDGHQLKCNLVESPDFSPSSHELLHNEKLEISGTPKSEEFQQNSFIDHDNTGGGSSTQMDKPSQQESLLKNKIDSTVPLREIDPPIRDSPQSPDPEPQFVKPSSIEKSHSIKIEEIGDAETYNSVSIPPKVENNFLSVDGQAMLSNMWPIVGGPVSNVRNLDFKPLDLQGPGIRGQDIIEAHKQIDGESPGLKHPKILGQGKGHSNPGTGSDTQGSGPKIDAVTKCPGPGMSGPSIWNSGPDMKDPGHRSLREKGIIFPDPDMKGPCMQGISPNMWGPGAPMQDQGKCVRDPGTDMHGSVTNMREPDIHHHNTDRIGSGPVMRGSGSRSPVRDMERSCLQGVNPEVKGPDPDMRHNETEIRGQILVPAVINPHMGRPGPQNERRDPVMNHPSLERPGPHMRSSGSRGALSAMYHGSPYTRGASPSLRGSVSVQRQSRHDGSPVLEERGPRRRSFQSHAGDADLSRVGGGRERSFDMDAATGSEGIVLRTDRLSPATTDKMQGPQREQVVPMRGPGPNINYKSGGSNNTCIGQDSSVPLDIRPERSVHGPAIRESETMHKCSPNWRDPDKQGRNMQVLWLERQNEQLGEEDPCPMPNITNSDWRGPASDIKGQGGQNKGLGPHIRDPDWGVPRSDIRNDWRGTDRRASGPVRGGSFIQDEWRGHQSDGGGPNMEIQGPDRRGGRDQNFRESGSELRSLNMEDLRHDRRGPGGPDLMAPGILKRGPDMEVPMHAKRGPGGPDFRGPRHDNSGLTMEAPGPDSRGLGGPDFRGPGPDMRGPAMGAPEPGRKGPGGPDFRGPGPERSLSMEGPRPDRRGPGGLDFRGPGPDRRGPVLESPGPDKRGHGGPDFRGPGLDSRGLAIEAPGPDSGGPGGPDFRGPGPERRGPAMEGPAPERTGPGGPDFRGLGPERRSLSMERPGPDNRGPGGSDFRVPGPDRRGPAMEGPGPERRGPGCPDFSGTGLASRGLTMETLGPDSRGPGGPDFRGPGPGRRGPSMEGPAPERRGPGGPDFRGPGPERRSLSMERPGPDIRGPGGPDFRGPGPERRGLCMERPGLDSRGPGGPDFRGPRPDSRGPAMETLGPDSRGPGGPDFRGPEPGRRGPAMEGPAAERRGPGGPDFRGPGPERRSLSMEPSGSDSRRPGGPDFRGLGLERRSPAVEGPGTERRGPRGPDFRGPGPDRRGLAMEGPGSERRGPGGPDLRGPGPERRSLSMEHPGPDSRRPGDPDFRGPGHERGHTMGGQELDRRGPGGPDFQGPGLDGRGPANQNTGGLGPDRRGPFMRMSGQDIIGLGSERTSPDMESPGPHSRGPEGPHFRASGHSNIERPGSDGRVPDIRGPRPERPGFSMEGLGPDRRGPGDPNFRGPGPERRPSNMQGPESERRAPHFRGMRPERPVLEGPGPNRKGQRGPDFRGSGCDNKGPDIEGPVPYRQEPGGPGFREPGPERISADMECPEPNWRRSGGPDFRGQSIRLQGQNTEGLRHRDDWGGADFGGSEPIQESPDIEGPGPDRSCQNIRAPGPMRRNIRGPGPDMSNLNQGDRWKGPDFMGSAPEEDDWSGPGCRGTGPVQDDRDMVWGPGRGGPGNEWRDPDDGPNRLRPGPFFRGERDPDNRGQGHDRRGPDGGSDMRGGPDMGNDWLQPDFRGNMRGPNMEGSGAHRGGPDPMNSHRNRRGFEIEDLDRRGPGGPDLRQPGPENRNSNIEGLRADGRFSDYAVLGSERRGVDMERPGSGRKGFEHDFRREKRGPGMRRRGSEKTHMRGPGPESLDRRHGPGRWDANIENPGLDFRGSESAPPHFNTPHQVNRFQGPSDPHSAPHSGPPGPAQNRGGNSCPSFDNRQVQQAVKPQRHRAALLPTPTEGPICFPNHMSNNPDVFSPKRKQMDHPTDREWSMGRRVSRDRELVKGQEQEKSSAGSKISSPANAGIEPGKEIKEEGNKTDKQGSKT